MGSSGYVFDCFREARLAVAMFAAYAEDDVSNDYLRGAFHNGRSLGAHRIADYNDTADSCC